MLGLVKAAQILAALLPLIHQAIVKAEEILGAGQGSSKLNLVLETVEATLPAVGATAAEVQQLRGPISGIVSGLVNALNLAGIFKRSAPAT